MMYIMRRPARRPPTPSSVSVARARQLLPELLAAAERGGETQISRRGRPVAVLGPLTLSKPKWRTALASLIGSGRGLWGAAGAHVRGERDEW